MTLGTFASLHHIRNMEKYKSKSVNKVYWYFLCPIVVLVMFGNVSVNGLILTVGEKCDNSQSLKGSRDVEIVNGTIFGYDPPVCDPSMPLECISGRCQCKRGFTISRNGTKCLEIARNGLDSPCEESIQCWKGLLGRLSECRRDNGRCRCYESETLPIVFHQGRCYYGESLGDFCQIDGLCEATTPNAECRTTCQCKEGYIPSWDKSKCLQIAVNGLNSTCEENVQCEKSSLGTLSECSQDTMKCQCYQIHMVPTLFFSGRCYFGAALGDVCQVNPQCQVKTEHSTCGSDGKCKCVEGHVSNRNQTSCLPIPLPADSSTAGPPECVEDIQCTRALGHFARCNTLKRKCECYVPQDHKRENDSIIATFTLNGETTEGEELLTNINAMVIIGSKCHSARSLGQTCKFNKQCSAPTPNSICYNGMCECRETHVVSHDGRKCLEVAKNGLYSLCDEDNQCQSSSLGQLSRCQPDKKMCECSNILPVIYYDKKCYFHRQLGSPCDSHIECKAGGNFFAECSHQKRCTCTNGTEQLTDHSCTHTSGGAAGGRLSLGWLLLLIALLWPGLAQ